MNGGICMKNKAKESVKYALSYIISFLIVMLLMFFLGLAKAVRFLKIQLTRPIVISDGTLRLA